MADHHDGGHVAQPAPQRASLPPMTITRVGNYELGKTIGKGQFGSVKLGIHMITAERVAIKIISKNKLDAKTLKMVYREVMDFIVAHVRLKEKDARRFFRQVVQAIDYCHSLHVIHRDLKAENLLLDSQFRVKVIDFGLSNCYTPGDLMQTFCGSPTYTAPELIKRQKYEGPEVDIWSMGVLLYVLVCGGLPFDGSSFQELFTKIVNCQYYVPDYVSPDCRDLIGRMLVVDPKQRATIDQIREHRWVLEDGAPVAKFSGMPFTMPTTLDDIDMSLVAEMEHVGYEQEHVIRAILSESYDEAAATYFLLKAKRHKEDEVRLARHKSQEVSHKVKRQVQVPRQAPFTPQPVKVGNLVGSTPNGTDPYHRAASATGAQHVPQPHSPAYPPGVPEPKQGKPGRPGPAAHMRHRRHHTLGAPGEFNIEEDQPPPPTLSPYQSPPLSPSGTPHAPVYTSTVPPPLNLNGDISPSHSPSKKGKSVSPRRHVIISEASKSPTSKTLASRLAHEEVEPSAPRPAPNGDHSLIPPPLSLTSNSTTPSPYVSPSISPADIPAPIAVELLPPPLRLDDIPANAPAIRISAASPKQPVRNGNTRAANLAAGAMPHRRHRSVDVNYELKELIKHSENEDHPLLAGSDSHSSGLGIVMLDAAKAQEPKPQDGAVKRRSSKRKITKEREDKHDKLKGSTSSSGDKSRTSSTGSDSGDKSPRRKESKEKLPYHQLDADDTGDDIDKQWILVNGDRSRSPSPTPLDDDLGKTTTTSSKSSGKVHRLRNGTTAGPSDVAAATRGSSFIDSFKKGLGGLLARKPEPRQARFPLNESTTSHRPAEEILGQLRGVLDEMHVRYTPSSAFCLKCETDATVFEVEICRLPFLHLNGVRFRRIGGDGWKYTDVCQAILGKLSLGKKEQN